MNKCQHNEKFESFCVSEHCEWKQAGGCPVCMKKYHNHVGNTKFLNEQELQNILKKFGIDHSYKPNCRSIQQAIFSYFGTLKNQVANSIDLICKTFITQLGSPYMFQNNLFTVHKRIKNNQFKKINQKDLRKLYESSKKVNITQLSKQEGKLYKDHLKKNQKFISSLQSVMNTYEALARQLLQNFKHQKATFDSLNNLIKQTLQSFEQSTSLLQFHQKQMEKNRNQKLQKQKEKEKQKQRVQKQKQKEKEKEKKRSFFNNESQIINNQKSGRLHSSTKQKQKSEFVSTYFPLSKQNYHNQSNNHKFGVKDFEALQKGESKEIRQQSKHKKEVSLDKRLNSNGMSNSQQLSSTGKQKKRNQFTLLDDYKVQTRKQKIFFDKKNEFMGSEFFSDITTKKSQTNTSLQQQKKDLNIKDSQINMRKQMLIQLMKNNHNAPNVPPNCHHQREKSCMTTYNNENQKINENQNTISNNYNSSNSNYINLVADLQSIRANNNNNQQNSKGQSISIGINSDSPIRKNLSVFVQQKKQNSVLDWQQVKLQSKQSSNILPKWQIKSILNIEYEKQQSGSLDFIKKLVPKNHMNAHPKLPIQQFQEKQKQIGCSRLIIVPTNQKFKIDKSDQCDSPLLKKKVNLSKNNDQNNQYKYESNEKKLESSEKVQKHEISQQQSKSLNLLLKSIHAKPEEAISLLQLAIKEASNNLSAAEYLSFLYLENNKPRQALHVCNLILDRFEIITKQNQELLINLQNNKAAALNILGRYSETIVLLQRCLKIKQKDTMLKNLADAYYFNSNYEKAIYFYQKTLKLSPNFDQACYNMAVCLYIQCNFHNARMSLMKALQIAPRNNDYLELKKNIQLKISPQLH